MATVSTLGTPTFDTNAGNKTVTATPAVGDLIVVVAASTGLAGGTTAVTDNQATGGTYVQVDVDRTGFSTTGVLTCWVRNDTIRSATSTVFTAAQAASSGGGLVVLKVTGMSIAGLSAVRRIGVASYNTGGQSSGGSGTVPAPVLAATPLSANPIITGVANGTNSTTTVAQRVGYSEAFDNGYTVPATGLEVSFLSSGETSATITYNSTTASTFASFAIELDASVPQFDYVTPGKADKERLLYKQGAVGRSSVW